MKKSVLIPYDRYLMYKNLQRNSNSRDSRTGSGDNNNNNDDNAQGFAEAASAFNAPVSDASVTQSAPTAEQFSNTGKLDAETIIDYLPKRNRSKGATLLQTIIRNPNLDWNNKGELLVHRKSIPHSHISDLLHDALNNTKNKPIGANEFYANLTNVPLSLVTNPRRRQILVGGQQQQQQQQQQRQQKQPRLPPPGLPNKPPKPLLGDDWSNVWKTL